MVGIVWVVTMPLMVVVDMVVIVVALTRNRNHSNNCCRHSHSHIRIRPCCHTYRDGSGGVHGDDSAASDGGGWQ